MTSVPREPGSLYPQVWGSCPGVRVEPPRSKTAVGLWLSHLACYLLCERVRSQGLLLLLKHLRCPRDRGIGVALFISRRIFSYSDLGNNSTFSLVHLPRKGGSQTKAFWNLVGDGWGEKIHSTLPFLGLVLKHSGVVPGPGVFGGGGGGGGEIRSLAIL